MNCKKCGSALTENDQFCKSCGTPVNETNVNNQETNMNVGSTQNVNEYQNTTTNMNMGQNNTQPSWAAGYSTQPTYNQIQQQKGNGNGKFIIIGIIIAVAIFAGILVVGMFGGDDDTNTGLTGGNNNSNINQTGNRGNYKVSFKGFSFNIPDNLVYEEDSGVLMIGDEEGTWVAQIEIEEGNFAQIKANKGQLQSMMQQSGFTSSVAQEKTLGGVEFITMEISVSGQNAIAALTKANSMYFIGVTAMNLDNEFDYSLLETIAPIISSASYSGATSNMEIGSRLDMNKIAEIAK